MKNVAWILPQLVVQGARKLDDLKPIFSKDSEHPYLLDQVKQLGFYTDCLGKAHWTLPNEVIDEKLARTLVQTAKLLAKGKQISKKEIELWMKHIGPVWKKDPAWMKQALINWYAEMQQQGLATEGNNKMQQFIRDGIQEWSGSNLSFEKDVCYTAAWHTPLKLAVSDYCYDDG